MFPFKLLDDYGRTIGGFWLNVDSTHWDWLAVAICFQASVIQ